VLRQGRTSPAQGRALEELMPRYGVGYQPSIPDWENVFLRKNPLVLEIGSGMGETTAAIAKAHPELDFIAVEVHGPGVGSLLKRIAADNLSNLRVIRHDAAEVLQHMIPDGALAAIHLFFPDPWPKKRHHKRRLVQAPFVSLAVNKLKPGGILHAATDWPDYANQIEDLLKGEARLEAVKNGFVERPTTKFETRGLRLGHPIRDLCYRRRESPRAVR